MSLQREIALLIAGDISDRAGLGDEWDLIDDDVKESIIKDWVEIINNKIANGLLKKDKRASKNKE